MNYRHIPWALEAQVLQLADERTVPAGYAIVALDVHPDGRTSRTTVAEHLTFALAGRMVAEHQALAAVDKPTHLPELFEAITADPATDLPSWARRVCDAAATCGVHA